MRNQGHIILLLFLLSTKLLFPQPGAWMEQLSFRKDIDQQAPRFYPTGFQARFFDYGNRALELGNTRLYREKGVKKISVYTNSGQLRYFFELDSAGVLLRSGYPVGIYLAASHSEKKGSTWLYSMTYYDSRDNSLVSSDTTFRTTITYRNGDTVMSVGHTRIASYKVGHLINERNQYYNEHYPGSPADGYTNYYMGSPIFTANGKGKPVPHKKQQPRKDFAVNYFADSVYYCGERSYDESLYAYRDSAGQMTDCQIPKDHRFRRELKTNQNNYNIEGEGFTEPVVMREAMFCGNALFAARQRAAESFYYSFSFTQNERGLYDSCFTMYYAPDTSRTAREMYYKNRREVGQQAIFFNDGSDPGPRRTVPDKALTYFIRYEYFY